MTNQDLPRARLIALMHIERATKGLNLADADDRAVFRTRMDDSYGMTRLHFIREQARSLGYDAKGNRRSQLVRAIANGYLTERGA